MIDLIASSLLLAALTLLPPQSAHIVTGRVQDNVGKPVGGVRVCAYAEDFDPNNLTVGIPCAFSDARGRFAIAVNKASKYKLHYHHGTNGYWSTYLPFFRHPSASIPEVLLDEANAQAAVKISMLPENGLLVGRSVDAKTGLPVESTEFILCRAANPEMCWRTSAKSSDGSFAIPAPYVPFTLRVKADGFDDWVGTNGEDQATPITVAPETKAEIAVYLRRS